MFSGSFSTKRLHWPSSASPSESPAPSPLAASSLACSSVSHRAIYRPSPQSPYFFSWSPSSPAISPPAAPRLSPPSSPFAPTSSLWGHCPPACPDLPTLVPLLRVAIHQVGCTMAPFGNKRGTPSHHEQTHLPETLIRHHRHLRHLPSFGLGRPRQTHQLGRQP